MRRVTVLTTLTYMLIACTPTGDDADAGQPDPFAGFGEPIDAPRGEWDWIEFEDSACGNGSPAGVAVNRGDDDAGLVFYLEGGGLCWDDDTCNVQSFAAFVDTGLNAADSQVWASQLGSRGIFNRGDADNPFAAWSFVYVPYCTGDVHIGNQPETSYGVSHVGYANIGAFLQRVVPTFKEVDHVLLTGTSAGAYGTMMNYDRVRQAFAHVERVDMLIDSAPPFTTTYFPIDFQNTLRAAWNAESVLPADCPADACADFHGTFLYVLDKYPEARVGLVSSLEDQTIRFFIGVGQGSFNGIPASTYRLALGELIDTVFVDRDNTSVFFTVGDKHVFLYDDPLGSAAVYDVTLTDWLRKMLEDGRWGLVLP